jgi:hypothetical protein
MIAWQGLAMEMSEEKETITSQLYGLVDIGVRRLDHQLRSLEEGIKGGGACPTCVSAHAGGWCVYVGVRMGVWVWVCAWVCVCGVCAWVWCVGG